jgi:membrane associated rhomboid family serine protease
MLDDLNQSLQLIIDQTQQNKNLLAWIIGLPWGVFILSRIYPAILCFGITPRSLHGLIGILCSPFLHVNFNHIFYNTLPLLVLSDFLLIHGLYYFSFVTISIMIIGGFLLWLFGKTGIHVGASGLITGYWAVLVSNIYEQGTLTAILLGCTALYTFAGIFFGIFPKDRGVSWEGHLFGLIAGIIISILIKTQFTV